MSPFIIYAIVLSIAYILYYATQFTMDMHAKPKGVESQTETISVDNGHETHETAFMPKTVTEDPFTGDFNIAEASEPERQTGEVHEETTANNTEEDNEGNEEDKSENDMNDNNLKEEEPAAETPAEEESEIILVSESEEQHDIQESEEEEETNLPEQTGNADAAFQPETEEPSEAADDYNEEADGITTMAFSDTINLTRSTEQDDDIRKAFDPDLALPKFGVTSIVGTPADSKVEDMLNDVNTKLIDNVPKGDFMEPAQFAALMRGKREESNIAYKDEYTKW